MKLHGVLDTIQDGKSWRKIEKKKKDEQTGRVFIHPKNKEEKLGKRMMSKLGLSRQSMCVCEREISKEVFKSK